jgi:acyl carrier protein
MVLTESEIYTKVQRAVADALAVDEEEVTPDARLTEDLGAESIDFLDIAFNLEKAFGITIKPNEMLTGNIVSEQYVGEGRITDAGMEELRRRLPHGNFEVLERSRAVKDFLSVFTVEALVRFVRAKLHACH